MMFCEELVLVLFKDVPLPQDLDVFFRARALFWTCCRFLVWPLLVTFLTELSSSLLCLYGSCELLTRSLKSLFERSLLIFILLYYRVDKAIEVTEALLELALLEEVDPSLILSLLTFISIPDGSLAICKGFKLRAEVEKCIFTNSLMGTTIQDDDVTERSDD